MNASVEKGVNAPENSIATPHVVISSSRDWRRELDRAAKAVLVLVVIIFLTCMFFMSEIYKDRVVIEKLKYELANAPHVHDATVDGRISDRMSYLEGFSGMIDDGDTVALAARAVMVSGESSTISSTVEFTVSSTIESTIASTGTSTLASIVASSTNDSSATESCHTETEAPTTTATFFPVDNSTTAADNSATSTDTTLTTVHTMMTTTIFSNNTGTSVLSGGTSTLPAGSSLVSVDALSASSDSSTTTLTVVPFITTTTSSMSDATLMTPVIVPTSFMSCLEYGDGRGPCDRSYGAPNTPPSSFLSLESAPPTFSMVSPSPTFATVPPPSASGVTGSTTADTGAVSGTGMATTTTTSSSSITEPAVCVPPTTIFVTISSATPTIDSVLTIESIGTGTGTSTGPSTLTSTSTTLMTTITSTLPPAATTETVSTATTLASAGNTTSSLSMITATGFTLTMTARNGTYTPTTGQPTVATLPANSGGEKAAGGKPLGASGNGSTGNGMYCVVMLVTLLALLI